MKYRIAIGLALAAAPLSSALAMPVSTFLQKADALQRKGPLAMFSGDLKLLMNQVKADSVQLRVENQAAAAAGRPKAYCTPGAGVQVGHKEVLAAMRAVPAAQRARTTTRQALRAYFARNYPCKV